VGGDPVDDLGGHFAAGELGHPLDLVEVGDRHDAGQDRDVDPAARPVHEAE
jgi:hypothetical protein